MSISDRINSVWKWCRRYLSVWTIIFVAIVTMVVCYGDHSVFRSIDQNRVIDSLRVELQAIRDSTEYYRELNNRLTTDPELVERMVRERHNMKRANEDVYIFEQK